jgi:hypothetical protein
MWCVFGLSKYLDSKTITEKRKKVEEDDKVYIMNF